MIFKIYKKNLKYVIKLFQYYKKINIFNFSKAQKINKFLIFFLNLKNFI